MTVIGIDCSGKIDQLPIVIASVKAEKPVKLLDELKTKIRKRHKGLASRRRIKASDLTNKELEWVVKNINFPYSVIKITSRDLEHVKKKYINEKNWDFVFLGSVYYQVISDIYDRKVERISVDRDYLKPTMLVIIRTIANLFSLKEEIPRISISSSDRVEIKIADLIAGTARRGLIKTKKPDKKLVGKIFSTRRPSQARMHPSRSKNSSHLKIFKGFGLIR